MIMGKSSMLAIASLLIAACGIVSSQRVTADDLELTIEMGRYSSPSDITFTKDGTLWACNKRGILLAARRNKYDDPREILDLRDVTCEDGERGLLGVAPHYDFGEDNPYVYLIYTFKKNGNCRENGSNGPVTRLSRFTCNAGGNLKCDIDSEEMFLESPSFPYDHHNSGAIKFGKDKLLYATIGDGGESPTAQERSNLFGTMVRIAEDGTIPSDNPYVGDNSRRCGTRGGESGSSSRRCQEIFAYGLRNPFRIAMNPNKRKTEIYINDVGASLWEEVSIGGDGYAGANYGWPIREGPCRKGSDCGKQCRKNDDYEEPEHFYHHDRDGEGAITGGAFVPDGAWGSEYEGKYLYADYVFGGIYVMDFRGNGDRNSCPLKSDYRAERIVDFPDSHPSAMAFNPRDGHLYYLTRGFGGRLNRVQFVGEVNRPPQPVIRASKLNGAVGKKIEFDATDSIDPDGDELEFEWDFDGDGEVDSNKAVDTFRYEEAGIYEVTLKVRDGKGHRPSTSINIGIGQHPTAAIIEPAEGAMFFVGQEFVLTGRATGGNIGNEAASMTWEVKQHHGGHFHPYLEPTPGNRVRLQPAPSPEDALASTNSYLEVILTVTDDVGLTTTVSRNVMPILRTVEVTSFPGRHTLLLDNFEVKTPATLISWANHPLKVEAPGGDWFAWSDGGDQTHTVKLSKSNDEVIKIGALFETSDTPNACFAGEATVQVWNVGPVPMKDLRIGDKVKVAGDKFSDVYSFGHYDADAEIEYLSIDAGLNRPLLITSNHMVLVESNYVSASLLTEGDTLILADGGVVTVQDIRSVTLRGAFAPFTKDGSLVVDGVVVSSFVALQPGSGYFTVGGFETFSLHGLAYLFESPHRLVCEINFNFCANELYSERGLSTWIESPLVFSQWLLQQRALIVMSVVVPVGALLLVVALLESVAKNVSMLLVAFVAFVVWRRTYTKRKIMN